MGFIRRMVVVAAVIMLGAFSLRAQTDSVVQLTAEANGLALAGFEPPLGTYFSIDFRGGAAPYPIIPPGTDLAIYVLDATNRIFLVDYVAETLGTNTLTPADLLAEAESVTNLIAEVQSACNPAPDASFSPMARLSVLANNLASGSAYANAVYLTNMIASKAGGGMNASFFVAGGTNFVPYDILFATNLAAPFPDWSWLGIAYTSNSYSLAGQPSGMGFYALAKPAHTMTVGWGDNQGSQCDVPYRLTNCLQVAAGFGQSMALKADGTILVFGTNFFGEGVAPAGLSNVSMIAAGWYHDVALLTNGAVTAWGYNEPSLGYPLTEVPDDLTNATVVSAQAVHTLALRQDGRAEAWGYGADGENTVPAGLSNMVAIAAGYNFNLAVVTNGGGTVAAWGNNADGQLNIPAGLSNVWDVAAGPYHGLALLKNGTVCAWGDNSDGETNVPAGLSNVVAIAAGGNVTLDTAYSLALKSDGTLVAWGDSPVVEPVGGLNQVIAIAAGADHALAIRTGPPTPVITLEPATEYQIPGGNATFSATGLGLYGVSYQWQVNAVDISGATNATLTVTNVSVAEETNVYEVVVTDNAGRGSLASSNVSIGLILAPPVIVSETLPTNQTVLYGTNVTLSVVATGLGETNGFPLTYQWLFNDAVIPYANSDTHTFRAAALSLGIYSVLVSNVVGGVSTAWHIAVVNTNGLQFTVQPTNQYQVPGGNVVIVAGALSTNAVTYQWQFDGANLDGATNAILVLTNFQAAEQGQYQAIASDSVSSLVSSNMSLSILTSPTIASKSASCSLNWPFPPLAFAVSPFVNYGTLSTNIYVFPFSEVNLSVMASAPGQTNGFSVAYQWQLNGTNLPEETFSNCRFPALNDGTYKVQVANAAGQTNANWQITLVAPGNALGWGDDEDGESAPQPETTNVVAVAAGYYHSVAALDNGRVIQWGYNWGNVPADLTNAVAVAAGYAHSVALKSDGTVETWGTNTAIANYVPSGIAGVKAVAAGWDDNVVLLTNGTVTAWGYDMDFLGLGDLLAIPDGLTNVTAISVQAYHALALCGNGQVVTWGDDSEGACDVPPNLTNIVAVAAGGEHSLALSGNGTVTAWGYNEYGQTSVPAGLSNVIAIAAGETFSVALKNDGTLVAWGDNTYGQTNVPAMPPIKFISAGGFHTVAAIYSPLVMYPVEVTKDLLLVYNTNSADSAFVLNYYLAHRPMVAGANVLGIGWPGIFITNSPTTSENLGLTNEVDYESIHPADFSADILSPIQSWLAANPTLRPQYVVLMLDVPSRVNTSVTNAANFPFYSTGMEQTVSYQLATEIAGWQPFVTHLNMFTTNDCVGYINKLANMASNSPNKLIISASASGYANTNWYFDDSNILHPGAEVALAASNGVVQAGASPASVTYTNVYPGTDTNINCHITNGFDLAGYLSWGAHSTLAGNYAYGYVNWSGESSWYLIETIESFNGRRYNISSGHFTEWFSENSFGGANYSNTAIGAVSSPDEPVCLGVCNPQTYFGLWEAGRIFGVCAWTSMQTQAGQFQAIGDPFVIK